jgi:hypothetical protein
MIISVIMRSALANFAFGVLAVASLSLQSCRNISPDWNGRWTLSESESTRQRANFRIATTPNGAYQMDNGTYAFTFACNGHDYVTPLHRMLSCARISNQEIELTSKQNGETIKTSRWKLSEDGKTLTAHTTVFHDGKSENSVESYGRVSGPTNEFVGSWGGHSNRPMVISLQLTENSLHYEISTNGQNVDLPLNGSEAQVHNGIPGMTMTIKPNGPGEFQLVSLFNGNVVSHSTLTIASDNQTLVEETWRQEKPQDKDLVVYERR